MIPLAVPAQVTGGGGAVPAGARSHLDFQNALYWSNGMIQAVTALLGDGPNTVQAGGGFDAGEISGSGMFLSISGNNNRPSAIGDFYDDLADIVANGGTVVVTLNFLNPGYGTVVGWYDDESDNDSFDWVSLDHGSLSDGYDIEITPSPIDAITGIHTVGMIINRDIGADRQYAISLDGDTSLTDTASASGNPAGYPDDPFPTSSLVCIHIGHDGDDQRVLDDVYIRSITTYDPMTPEDMETLLGGGGPGPGPGGAGSPIGLLLTLTKAS